MLFPMMVDTVVYMVHVWSDIWRHFEEYGFKACWVLECLVSQAEWDMETSQKHSTDRLGKYMYIGMPVLP